MVLRNLTPFVPFLFQSWDEQRNEQWVLVVRGTFRIVPLSPLALAIAQHPIVVTDVFHGDPHRSSLRMESDLAPFKPRADIHVNAIARVPGGREMTDWLVRIQLGALEKTIRVTGPRSWVRDGSTYRLTAPEPCLEVPLRYEYAFGGVWNGHRGESEIFEENPIGVGYVKEGTAPCEHDVPAPRIESPDDPINDWGRRYRPEGLGPINRAWLPRRALAGTFDGAWRAQRAPDLPFDFRLDFYCSSHPDLTYPGYLTGDEDVTLEGVDPDGPLRFQLPGHRIELLVKQMFGAYRRLLLNLDTVLVDLPSGEAHLTWRVRFNNLSAVRAFEIRTR